MSQRQVQRCWECGGAIYIPPGQHPVTAVIVHYEVNPHPTSPSTHD